MYMYEWVFLCYCVILFPTVQPSQVGSLFTFLARQGAKHKSSITVDENIYDQVYTANVRIYAIEPLIKDTSLNSIHVDFASINNFVQ